MSSGEERLEEMLKAVMGTGETEIPDDVPTEIADDVFIGAEEEITDEVSVEAGEAITNEVFAEAEEEITNDAFAEMPNEISDGLREDLQELIPESEEEEMLIDPLDLLAMSEEEIDRVLEKEAGIGGAVLGRKQAATQDDKDLSDLLKEDDALSDIQDLLSMSENHEQVFDDTDGVFSLDEVDLDSESVQNMLGLTPGLEEDFFEEPKEEIPATVPEEEPEEKIEQAPEQETEGLHKKPKKERKRRKEKKAPKEGKEKKEGFGKKLISILFGSDDDELDAEEENGKGTEAEKEDQADDKKATVKEDKKAAKKKEKKKKPDKKKEPDPKKAAKEKLKKEKNAEKAKKKAAKAEIAEKERRAAKKLPKKKVIVWVLFCASIGAGILLVNSVGMKTLHLNEARNAFYDKDFETAYQLLNGSELSEEDQIIFQQSSAILHLNHAEEAYENHLKLEKPVMALEDLLKGVGKYQGLLAAGQENLITPELTTQYQNILKILRDNYSLSEDGAMEINALDDDYEFSLQLEALVNGEIYQSQSEIERQEEETAADYSELDDILPEEEEYLNGSSN